ncbi:hypothetical protein DL767_007775 [Monosporascus sp. MG133]|nr:hypothetical protein DL767_007775 [Monosporascus sp. MG133]
MAQRLSKRDKDFKPGSFYTDQDYYDYSPKGSASMAAQQMYFPNMNILRKFGWLSCRLQLDYQMELGNISDRLFGLDIDIDEGALGTTSPPNPGEHSLRCWERDGLITKAKKLYKEYIDFILVDQKMQQLPRVSERAHLRHYNIAKRDHRLSDEQLEVLRYAHDFITVAPDTTFQKFEFLLFSDKPWVQKGLRFISWLTGQPVPDGGYTAYGVRAFEWLVNGVMALMGCALFLAPVGIFYLGSLPPGGLFGVMAAFCFVFITLMARLERRINPLLFGISAYSLRIFYDVYRPIAVLLTSRLAVAFMNTPLSNANHYKQG